MSFRWTDNEMDNVLFEEFAKENPNDQRVRELIALGANINAVDRKGESVLIDAIWNVHFGLDISFIQLIVDLGADLNYTEDGLNCLYDAVLFKDPAIVELLLKAGADPNCYSTAPRASLLDWAESILYFEKLKSKGSPEAMTLIVHLLKTYGAKPISSM